MIAVVNGISFQYPFATSEQAMEYMHRFLDICRRIKKDEITNIQEIRMGVIDSQNEIAPGVKLIQLLQNFKTREERSLLLSILTNNGTYQESDGELGLIDGKVSYICAHAVGNFLESLFSVPIFREETVTAIINDTEYALRNLSKQEHIEFYREELGIRRYIANSAKHKFDRENPYGKGKVGSRMDLTDEEAQELLNQAIYVNGRLYAKKKGCYYAFQYEGDVNYHGYRADDLQGNIKSELDKIFGIF